MLSIYSLIALHSYAIIDCTVGTDDIIVIFLLHFHLNHTLLHVCILAFESGNNTFSTNSLEVNTSLKITFSIKLDKNFHCLFEVMSSTKFT